MQTRSLWYIMLLISSVMTLIFLAVRISGAQLIPAITEPPLALPSPQDPHLSSTVEVDIFLPFYNRHTFAIKQTYYVAQQQPGADNGNNGLFPVYQQGKYGPFKDFDA